MNPSRAIQLNRTSDLQKLKSEGESPQAQYTWLKHGVSRYGGEKWLQDTIAHGSGVQTCYETVLGDPDCAKDFFTYATRGDQNCGCNKAYGLESRPDDNADIYCIGACSEESQEESPEPQDEDLEPQLELESPESQDVDLEPQEESPESQEEESS